jgi:hypothetical protein
VTETSSFKGPHKVGATPPPFLPDDGSRASLRNVVFKEKTLDDGQSPKARSFEMHHTIVRTLQNRFGDKASLPNVALFSLISFPKEKNTWLMKSACSSQVAP